MTVSVAVFLGEVLLPFEQFSWSNYLLVAVGVLFKRGPHARFTGHELVPFYVKEETRMGWVIATQLILGLLASCESLDKLCQSGWEGSLDRTAGNSQSFSTPVCRFFARAPMHSIPAVMQKGAKPHPV